ncbi:MAG: pyridoxine 5'-phosphate synthase, partial [Alistipes sp.]|nr:pyridoxine 5'-phosphate synthase [Alistipes sp.]
MKSKLSNLIIALLVMVACVACCNTPSGENYKTKGGMIVFDEPTRAAGQESMLGFAADPIPVVRVGFVGLGMRGPGAVNRFTHLEGVEIKGLCDLKQENVSKCQPMLERAGMPKAAEYVGEEAYKELCERDDVDLIYIATDWLNHTPIALYAMEHGKHVAIEVPAATSLEECWQLVDTSERTRRHCMMLENCVYDFFELTCLNMAQQGLFGEILHAEGAYIHNLSEVWNSYHGNWRLDFNQKHRGDVDKLFMTKLSVNVNKIAVLRNSRGGNIPNVVKTSLDIERFGAEGITVHPRPDARHIRYDDVRDLKRVISTELNIEGNPIPSFIDLVLEVKPAQVTLVPDAEDAITSNAGWDTIKHREFLKEVCSRFNEAGIRTSIFV